MTRRLLVLRPEPGASETLARAAALDWDVAKAPLFTAAPCDWVVPDPGAFDAVMITSANAARLGGDGLRHLVGLPLYAVGAASAQAARQAGFADVRAGDRDAAALLCRAAEDGVARLLHLAGREHRDAAHDAIRIERRIVYGVDAVEVLPPEARAALKGDAVALLHSPRAAALFGTLIDRAGLGRPDVRIAAISPAALDAAGPGWSAAIAAAEPTDQALLAAAARLCE